MPSTPSSPTSTSRPCRSLRVSPPLLRDVGLRPMKLGLDLQGGLYLLYQVDTQSAIAQLLDSYAQDLRRALSQANLPFNEVAIVASAGGAADSLRVTLPAGAKLDAVEAVAKKALPDLPFTALTLPSGPALQGTLTTHADPRPAGLCHPAEPRHPAQPRQ